MLFSAFVIRPTKSQTRYCQEQNQLEEDSKTCFQTCEKKVMWIMQKRQRPYSFCFQMTSSEHYRKHNLNLVLGGTFLKVRTFQRGMVTLLVCELVVFKHFIGLLGRVFLC